MYPLTVLAQVCGSYFLWFFGHLLRSDRIVVQMAGFSSSIPELVVYVGASTTLFYQAPFIKVIARRLRTVVTTDS